MHWIKSNLHFNGYLLLILHLVRRSDDGHIRHRRLQTTGRLAVFGDRILEMADSSGRRKDLSRPKILTAGYC